MSRLLLLTLVAGFMGLITVGYGEAQDVGKLIAVLHPTQNSTVTGTVMFTKTEKGVKVVADVKGLTPGAHGFHIHQYGDCSAPNADSAGGHYNPMGKPHGAPENPERHLGDLGNLMAEGSGRAHFEYVDRVIAISGPNSIVGRGLIVHEGADDMKTQPTGNAGSRVACGVIGIASSSQ